jgi:hypothetical protein
MFPPPNVTNPAIIAIRATAPKINNQRGINSPLAKNCEPVSISVAQLTGKSYRFSGLRFM